MTNNKASIAPLVLLSVVDHYRRYNATRVVGVLLGNESSGIISITNSFAVPFEEYENSFFIDTSYLLNMFELFYKVNNKEKIVGWYHSGPKMYKNDIEISKSFNKYCDNPLLAIVNVTMEANDIPVQIYQLKDDDNLVNLNVQIGADETEEVGVEHLLRDIKEGTGSSIKDQVAQIVDSLKMYRSSIDDIIRYIENVESGMSYDFEIIELLQNILNDVPKITKTIDMSEIYSVELANTLIALNDLQKNRVE